MDFNPQALPEGTIIAGFRIERTLGAGGFGITYEGLSAITRRRVCIKEFFPRGIASREGATRLVYPTGDSEVVAWALDRFERSTTELCQLQHPNIVDVIHYVKENNTGYMIMEYVEGLTLDDWLIKRGAPPSPTELQPALDPILDALAYVHAMGRIHRDIAPDNIMIRPNSQPVLIDFGAVKIIEQRTRTARTFQVAKANYSPPEQTEDGVDLDRTADIYALGAVLYRAFAGAPPVDADKRKNGVLFRGADPYVPIAAAAARLPMSVAETVDRALSFRPQDRQATIEEIRAGLEWHARPGAPTSAPAAAPTTAHAAAPTTAYSAPPPVHISAPAGGWTAVTPPPMPHAPSAYGGHGGTGTAAPMPGAVPGGWTGPVAPPRPKQQWLPFAAIGTVAVVAVGGFALPWKTWFARTSPPPAVITELNTPPPATAPDEVFWQSIKDSNVPTLFEEFLKRYPTSPHASQARERLEALRRTAEPNRPADPSAAAAAYARGDKHFEKGEWDLAISDYTEAMRLDPRHVDAIISRGLCYQRKGDYDRAIEDYNEAIRVDPRSSWAYDNRGDAHAFKRDYDRAIADYSEAIRINPQYAVAYNDRGNAYRNKRDYDRAIADYNEAIRIKSDYANPHNGRGLAYVSKHDYDRAIRDFDEAIRINGKDAVFWYNRASTYGDKEQHDRAIQDYNEAIRLNPSYALAYNGRGFSQVAKRDYDRAIQDYNEAIRLDPDFAVAYDNRGDAYSYKRDYDRAIRDYSEAIRVNPRYAEAYRDRGNAYSNKSDHRRAIEDYNEAIRLNPNAAGYYNDRGNAYYALDDNDRALTDFNEAVRLNPNVPAYFNNRGNVYYSKADYNRSVTEYSEAIRLNPSSARYFFYRGNAYKKLNDRSRATADYRKALTLDPTDDMRKEIETALRDVGGSSPAAGPPGGEPRRTR